MINQYENCFFMKQRLEHISLYLLLYKGHYFEKVVSQNFFLFIWGCVTLPTCLWQYHNPVLLVLYQLVLSNVIHTAFQRNNVAFFAQSHLSLLQCDYKSERPMNSSTYCSSIITWFHCFVDSSPVDHWSIRLTVMSFSLDLPLELFYLLTQIRKASIWLPTDKISSKMQCLDFKSWVRSNIGSFTKSSRVKLPFTAL